MKEITIYDYIEDIINNVLYDKKTYMSPKEIWNYAMKNNYFDTNYIKKFPDSSRTMIALKGGASCMSDIINKNKEGEYVSSILYPDKYTLKEIDTYLKNNKITLRELIVEVLSSINSPLTQSEIWKKAIELKLNEKIVLCNSPEREVLNYIYDDIRDYKDDSIFIKIKNTNEPIKFGLNSLSYENYLNNVSKKIESNTTISQDINVETNPYESNFIFNLLKELYLFDNSNISLTEVLYNFTCLNENIKKLPIDDNSIALSKLSNELNDMLEYFKSNYVSENKSSINNTNNNVNSIEKYKTKNEKVDNKPLGYLLYRMEQINKSLKPISLHIDNEEIYASTWKDIFVRTLRFICTNKNVNIDTLICSPKYTINNIECFSDMQLDIDYYEEIVDELYFYNEFDDEDMIYLLKKSLLEFNYSLDSIKICCQYNI